VVNWSQKSAVKNDMTIFNIYDRTDHDVFLWCRKQNKSKYWLSWTLRVESGANEPCFI